jgi:hypothetical protein
MNSGLRVAAMLGMSLLPVVAIGADDDAKPSRRVRIGGVMVSAGYASGPAWYPYYGYGYYPGWGRWGLYDPFWYSPWIHPGLYTGFGYGPGMGEVKLTSSDREAAVYIDGAYAGPAHKLKSIWLEPGAYNLEVRNPDGQSFGRRIYVLSGKELRVEALLRASKEERK